MLKPRERAKLQDCQMLIQSLRNILSGLPPSAVPDWERMDKCFREADQTISRLLRP